MTPDPYLDTSALAKWYLSEPRSEDFEVWVQRHAAAMISRLTVVELRCLLARRRRAREITAAMESMVFSIFERDIRNGHLVVYPLADGHAAGASDIMVRLKTHPLRTLDALHLAIAQAAGVSVIATADRVLAEAAKALGFEVARFD